MKQAVFLGLGLFGLWLLLSGHYAPLQLSLGVLSCAFVVWLAARMGVLDAGDRSVGLRPARFLLYAPWLVKEIALANLDIAKRILTPGRSISPTVVRVPTTQRSDLTRTLYANSITLTPGTVSIDVGDGFIRVHALSRESAEGLTTGEMGERVTALEKPR